jgi:SIR2-like domain
MSEFELRLNQARNGRGILFCGAGFSADCLNFNEEAGIGTGAHLLKILNTELQNLGATHGFRDLKNAADQYQNEKGELGLLNLLQTRFRLRSVSADMVDIVKFPWERIYTTNYDNGIELALQNAKKKANPINNTETVTNFAENSIVHLHGYIEKWDINNFRQSCVLGAESYLRLDGISNWLETFRVDLDRAEFVAFIGFNASDFHLSQVLFNISGLRKKIFFINREISEPDIDVRMTQSRFGHPMYIGRQGFAKNIVSSLASEIPTEPAVASFRRYLPPRPSDALPPVRDIEDMFIFGKIVTEHLARDESTGRSDYHVRRPLIESILEKVNQGFRIILLVGEICDGKTILLENLSNKLSISRPVYTLRHSYEDALDEVSRILHSYSNAVLVIENCFDLRDEKLGGLARMIHGSSGVLLLSCRNIAAEVEVTKARLLRQFGSFCEVRIPKMNAGESEALIALIDQIAGWRSFDSTTKADKVRFVSQSCQGSMPAFLLRLLKSEYVKQKYQEEYNKSSTLSKIEKTAVIVSLYVSHIGHDVPIGFLSNALHIDVGAMLDKLANQNEALKLVARRGESVRTVPAIGATNILEHMVPDKEIVDSVVTILEHLSQDSNRDDFERHVFSQFMRYSIMRSVVSDSVQINRFFDNISKIEYCRRQVLFWVQWHMAKVDLRNFTDAEKFLEQGYAEADGYEKRTGLQYNRQQLDDRRAKFLMLRARQIERQPTELFRDLKEAWEIVGRLLRRDTGTHHPFQTLVMIAETFASRTSSLLDPHLDFTHKSLLALRDLATKRLAHVPEGYERETAARALESLKSIISG